MPRVIHFEIHVDDPQHASAFIQKIQQAGGTIVVPKIPIPGLGWLAYYKDPDGNIGGIHEFDPTAK